jgi:cytochrome c peroxidase
MRTTLLVAGLALAAPPGPHRSPCDLVPLAGGRLVLTANHTADSASLVDLVAGKVLAEVPCGRRPVAIACSRDGRYAAVSNLWSGTVTLLAVAGEEVRPVATLEVGPQPRGLAFGPDGTLYVAIAGADEVAAIDVRGRRVVHRWPGPRNLWTLAVSADGRLLAAGGGNSGQVWLWETSTRKLLWERTIEDAMNLRGLTFTPDGSALVCAHAVRRDFPVSRENIEQGWVIDNRLTRLPVKADATPPLEQLALDAKYRAVADLHGIAFEVPGRRMAVSASGTHEVLLLDGPALPWTGADPGDFIDAGFANRLARMSLGGRPMGMTFLGDTRRLALANYLVDAVQVVDVARAELVRFVALGGPAELAPARTGETLFYDAFRSHHHWFSCHTCHTEGHTCGRAFDTLNDDSYGNPKLTPTLRGVTRTGPWTWHGWQKDLGAGVVKSYTETMFGPKPNADQVQAVVAFLGTLDHPPNPHRAADGVLTPAAQRGAVLFSGKARCDRCHHGDDYTAARNYDVKLEADGSPYTLWNPPSLRGLWERSAYLHDGRCGTLNDLLRGPHAPEMLGGQPLSPAERDDLIAFLRSL